MIESLGGVGRMQDALVAAVLSIARSTRGLEGAETAPQEVRVQPVEGEVELRVVVDTCSVEVFADGGRVVLTNQVFPAEPRAGISLFAEGAAVAVRSLTLRDLAVTPRG